MVIKKKDMAERISKAADSTPGLEDRLRHARELAHAHPIGSGQAFEEVPSKSYAQGVETNARLVTAPVELIDPNPFNARHIYRPERVNELAASIGAHGQDVPGIATHRHGRYVLAAGHYRLRAIKVLGLPTMELKVIDGLSDKELYARSYRENVEREGQTALDNALCWRDLLDLKLYASETELAEATGMSLPNINKTLRILKLTSMVLDIVKEDPQSFALSALYELALYEEVAGTVAAQEMARQIQSGAAGRKEIQEARALIEDPKQRQRRILSRPYRINQEGSVTGSLKVFGDTGRVMLDVVFQDAKAREEALADLKERFGVQE